MRVLVVDDDADCVEFISVVLKKRYPGLDVLCAKHGAEAMDMIKDGEVPVLVLADYRMPVMDGSEMGNQLKKAYGRHVDVVLVTGQPVKASFVKDFDGLLEKPFDLARLYSVVDAAIARMEGPREDR
ncbi:MAG: response regulator [Candidatus Lokiarchaeota archaeon]|nr:response regulator [Candidatus Lokiarchaeota archaeon]